MKIATKTTLPTHCNPKHKKDLDEGTDDNIVLDPPAVEDHVPTYVCNWAQAIVCDFPQIAPLKCQHTDCDFLVHHLCQSAWEQREGHPDTVARYCCLHHPQYKYQHVIDMSGVSKKSSSSNSGQELSVDTDATIAEHHNNGIELVHDGNNKLFRDESPSATLSTKDMTVSHLNESRQNIVVDGKMYRCNKVKVKGEQTNIVYVNYLQCGMALDKADGSKWKPYSEVKAALPSDYLRCYGILRAEFSKVRGKETSHFYTTTKAHICYNATALFGPIPETRVPLMLVFPSPLWNISKAVIDNMKEALSSVKDHHWINKSKCRTARQYLKELGTSKSLKKVYDQAMAVIQPFVTRVVLQHYKALTYFKVGVIRLRGVDSQYNLVGSLHCDYDDNENQKGPGERPQTLLLALDPFKLLYESNTNSGGLLDGKIKELSVDRGQAIVFTYSFPHSGGSNYTINQTRYVY